MNCLEFRRDKLADPRQGSPEALAHLRECAACRGFARAVIEIEVRIAATLSVPVPEGLAERIILRRKTGARFSLWP